MTRHAAVAMVCVRCQALQVLHMPRKSRRWTDSSAQGFSCTTTVAHRLGRSA